MSRSTSLAHQPWRQFSLPGDPDAIPPVVEAVMNFLRGSGCHPDDADAIALALQEGLANAVVHGCHNDRQKTVLCSAGCDRGGGVLIVIRDPGRGFDPTHISNPLTPDGMANDHGRGIHLMRSIMDEVWFEENGTCLFLRKY